MIYCGQVEKLISGENNEALPNIYCILFKFRQVIESRSPNHFGRNVTTRNVLATDYIMTTSFTFDERDFNQILFCPFQVRLTACSI